MLIMICKKCGSSAVIFGAYDRFRCTRCNRDLNLWEVTFAQTSQFEDFEIPSLSHEEENDKRISERIS